MAPNDTKVSDGILRRLPVVQDRGYYGGKWYPRIVRHKGSDWKVDDNPEIKGSNLLGVEERDYSAQ